MTRIQATYLPERTLHRLESGGAVCNKGGAGLCDTVGEGELEVGRHELLDVRAAHVGGLFDLDHTEDLHDDYMLAGSTKGFGTATHVNRPEAGTVTGGHVLVEALDGVGAREVTELLVHVVGAGARVVAQPDAKVLNLERLLLVDLENVSYPVPPAS